ncbi:MAG: serine/threonine-protein kinase [Myxococcales bacterium]
MVPETLGPYRLLSLLATGGMGELYRARDPSAVCDVALKVIRADLAQSPMFRAMFLEEGKIAGLLDHPNLVRVSDLGEDQGRFYLCLDLVEGQSAAALAEQALRNRDPLAPRFAAAIAEQVARGLDYAHNLEAAGQKLALVHRDVSPGNILVGYDGAVKLTDFGVARIRREQTLTVAGTRKGTPAYMAPEQLQNLADPRSDVFSLGTVLWELLAGRPLFEGKDDAELAEAVRSRPIAPPSTFAPDVPPAHDAVVVMALQRHPRARFQTARALAEALAALEKSLSPAKGEGQAEGAAPSLRVLLGEELRRRFLKQAEIETSPDDWEDYCYLSPDEFPHSMTLREAAAFYGITRREAAALYGVPYEPEEDCNPTPAKNVAGSNHFGYYLPPELAPGGSVPAVHYHFTDAHPHLFQGFQVGDIVVHWCKPWPMVMILTDGRQAICAWRDIHGGPGEYNLSDEEIRVVDRAASPPPKPWKVGDRVVLRSDLDDALPMRLTRTEGAMWICDWTDDQGKPRQWRLPPAALRRRGWHEILVAGPARRLVRRVGALVARLRGRRRPPL